MPPRSWPEAVENAIRRHVCETGSAIFTRQAFIDSELDAIVSDTQSAGKMPHRTISRELQHLCDVGLLDALGDGAFRLRDAARQGTGASKARGIFVLEPRPLDRDEAPRVYRVDRQWLDIASKLTAKWAIYQLPGPLGRGAYYAAAKVARIDSSLTASECTMVWIEPGSFWEFDFHVPFYTNGEPAERGLLYPNGRLNQSRVNHQVRLIDNDDFERIINLGSASSTAPSSESFVATILREEQQPWIGPVERSTQMVSRLVRNPRLRQDVLRAYDFRCAFTGSYLGDNRTGNVEVEAVHIMSVEDGGPDTVQNAMASNRTMHWMFDQGLMSLKDCGEILLSRHINDMKAVEARIFPDRRARLPVEPLLRPATRYLEWHRSHCFHP